MTELRIKLEKINEELKKLQECSVYSEVAVETRQRQIVEADRLHKIKINNLNKEVKRAVENVKIYYGRIDALIVEKEAIHQELEKKSNRDKVQCEYCEKYFTPGPGITRHKTACASKPVNKEIKEREEDLEEIKENIEARKAALKKELAELNKKSKPKPKPKPKPVKVIKPEPELPPELEKTKEEIEKIIEADLEERHPEPEE